MDVNYGQRLAVAGNQSTTMDLIESLLKAGYSIAYIINVGAEKAHMISDYADLDPFAAQRGIQHIRPKTYTMQDKTTVRMFEDVNVDMLIVVGWQRLIPKWLLKRLSIGAFGMHGSAQHLPKGRGRSPMNWSIIEGRDRFYTNLFRYDEGVDCGMIVGTQCFDIFSWDTIRSLQHKNALSQVKLLLEHLPALLKGVAKLTAQASDVEPTYYPKRTPEDGVIDWTQSCDRISRLVRAVARPYPGAFTFYEHTRVNIWAAHPFDYHLDFDQCDPGEIIASFHDTTFVVKCSDYALYVTDWDAEGHWDPEAGQVFESRQNLSWEKLAKMKNGGLS